MKKKILAAFVVALLAVVLLPAVTHAAVSISPTKKSVAVGKTVKIKLKGGKATSWKSSKADVVAITEATQTYAKVKALTAGKVTITAKAGKKSYKCTVTVTGQDAKTKKINSLNDTIESLKEQISNLKAELAEAKKKAGTTAADDTTYVKAVIHDDEYFKVVFDGFEADEYRSYVRFMVTNKYTKSGWMEINGLVVDGIGYHISDLENIPPKCTMKVKYDLDDGTKLSSGSVLGGSMYYTIYNDAGDEYLAHDDFDFYDIKIK